jgi:hypothetical protein
VGCSRCHATARSWAPPRAGPIDWRRPCLSQDWWMSPVVCGRQPRLVTGRVRATEQRDAFSSRSADGRGDHPGNARGGARPVCGPDAGLIAILWRAGLRISEAPALTESDLDPKTGSVLVRDRRAGRASTTRRPGRCPTAVLAAPTQARACDRDGARRDLAADHSPTTRACTRRHGIVVARASHDYRICSLTHTCGRPGCGARCSSLNP